MKKIEVVSYDPQWPQQFETVAANIREILGDEVVEIHHIGSTSVPGLPAKRDIDVLLIVKSLEASRVLEKQGFTFKGEINVPLRYFFSCNTSDRKVNLHVCEAGHGFINLNLSFRDWLRGHDDDRDEYGRLKIGLSKQQDAGLKSEGSLNKYCLAKDSFIKDVLRRSGYRECTVNFCMHHDEWKAVKQLCQSHFEQEEVAIPLDQEGQEHFVLYKGADVVGYAHLEKMPEDNAMVRIIIAPNALEDYFKSFIYRWAAFHDLYIKEA